MAVKVIMCDAARVAVQKASAERELTGENPEFVAWQAAMKAEKFAEQRRTETVTLPVEIHVACGGQIQYTSYFVDEGQTSQRVGGGHYARLVEHTTCSCEKCGSKIGGYERLARYAALMTAHRNRTD